MRKTFVFFALIAFTLFSFCSSALAGQPRYRQAVFFIGRNEYFVKAEYPQEERNRNEEAFRPMDAAPFVENGRTYVPVRYLALALGIHPEDIGWDEKTETVMLTLGDVQNFWISAWVWYPDSKGKFPENFTIDDLLENIRVPGLTKEDIIEWRIGENSDGQHVEGKYRVPPVVHLKLVVGSKTLYVNGQTKTMDVAPLIREGRTYLPARWVAEAFGYEVKWDEKTQAVLVGPPGNVPEPPVEPPKKLGENGPIDLTAAKNGTLGVPVNAVAPPSKWGFEPPIKRLDFEVGDRYATATRWDGSTFKVDLGAEVQLVVDKNLGDMRDVYPNLPWDKAVIWDTPYRVFAAYIPFIPVAEAFGVPRGNIVWDGEHLGLWGYYGKLEDYRVLTVGSKNGICRGYASAFANESSDDVWENEVLYYPLFAKDGVPMVGIGTVTDISRTLFAPRGGLQIIDGHGSGKEDVTMGEAYVEIDFKPSDYNGST